MNRLLSLLTGLYITSILIASPLSSATHTNMQEAENSTQFDKLERAIAVADPLMELQGFIKSKDNGEYQNLKTLTAKGRELLNSEDATTGAAMTTTYKINSNTIKYRKQYLYILVDSVTNILTSGTLNFTDGSTGWKTGDYPKESLTIITELSNDAQARTEKAKTLTDVSSIIADLENGLKTLYNSRIDRAYKLPLRFTEEDGLPGQNIDGNPNNSYIWDTPLLYLETPIDAIRITVTRATKQDNYSGSGTVMFCMGEFELYDAAGEPIPLREDMFQTNSLCSSDGGGIPALIDGNHNTWYHSAYNAGHDIVPDVGEYSYVQVNLDEPISTFRYRMVGRPHATYNRAPTDLGITAGDTYDPDKVQAQDPYNLQIIEKVTNVSQITDGGLYILYGNAMRFNENDYEIGEGSGYYAGLNLHDNKKPLSNCLFTFENAGDGKFHLHSLSKNYYIKSPTTHESANSTLFKKEAAAFTIQEHKSRNETFNIYHTGLVNDEYNDLHGQEAIFPLQDWRGEMGTRPITGLDKQTEFDGQSEWEIYKVSVDNFELMWLESVLASVEASGFTAETLGENPGQYNGAGAEEFKEALTSAQALYDTKDIFAAKAAADKLQANIEALSTLEINPIIIGHEYYIVSTYDAFYQQQQEEVAILTDVNDNSNSEIKSDNQPYWGILPDKEEVNKDEFIWILEEGNTKNIDALPGDTYLYLKNKATGEYMGTWDSHSTSLPMSKKPVLYFFRSAGGIKYNINSPYAQENFTENSGTHYALHILGHDEGKATMGHICLWHYGVEQSRWKLLNAGTGTTSIGKIIDESEAEAVSTTYYSPDGKISETPISGCINIVKTVYANGTIKSKKILVK